MAMLSRFVALSVSLIPKASPFQPRQEYFPPPCKETPQCLAKKENGLRTSCRCSGMWGPYNLEIVDKVKVGDHAHPLSLSPNLIDITPEFLTKG